MFHWRRFYAVLIYPGFMLGVVPAILLWTLERALVPPHWAAVLLAIALIASSIGIAVWTARLFVRLGEGTIAPWYPPKKLVVAGPYRYVRNPMIVSVILFLIAEALLFSSWSIFVWAVAVLAVNTVYFPLAEERRLEAKFGEDYVLYKANVPRWLPRVRPWDLPD